MRCSRVQIYWHLHSNTGTFGRRVSKGWLVRIDIATYLAILEYSSRCDTGGIMKVDTVVCQSEAVSFRMSENPSPPPRRCLIRPRPRLQNAARAIGQFGKAPPHRCHVRSLLAPVSAPAGARTTCRLPTLQVKRGSPFSGIGLGHEGARTLCHWLTKNPYCLHLWFL